MPEELNWNGGCMCFYKMNRFFCPGREREREREVQNYRFSMLVVLICYHSIILETSSEKRLISGQILARKVKSGQCMLVFILWVITPFGLVGR
jgi:hypothetical protein